MTPAELALNAAVLVLVLTRNLGVHAVTRRRFTIPIVIIVVIGSVFLRHIPTQGHDVGFDLVGLAAGVMLGLGAGLLLHVERGRTGQLRTRAGFAFAALWVVVIVARVAFSEGATHLYTHQVTDWSITHRISGSNAFTAMFVLMALVMIATMTATLAARAAVVGHQRSATRPREA